ncbi:MAG: pyridoxamine 5'-phosphate oxidase family protein [Halobacteriaceae archaeon]
MTEEAIDEFLERQGLGVLAFPSDEDAYSLPMSFGYDRYDAELFFQFAMEETSEKRIHLTTDRDASLTVFEWRSVDDWRSVNVRGPIRQLPPEEYGRAAAVFAAYARVASLEVFDEPLQELDLEWYVLDAESMTGRQSNRHADRS